VFRSGGLFEGSEGFPGRDVVNQDGSRLSTRDGCRGTQNDLFLHFGWAQLSSTRHVINSNRSNTLVSDIKPSKQFHPIPSPRARAQPTSVPSMSTNLYDILGVQRDATEEQSTSNPLLVLVFPFSISSSAVRKAYKKRALQTHPDRVPPDQKTTAEEEFRKVPRRILASSLLRLTPNLLGQQCIRSPHRFQ
jgi:DnaJ domain